MSTFRPNVSITKSFALLTVVCVAVLSTVVQCVVLGVSWGGAGLLLVTNTLLAGAAAAVFHYRSLTSSTELLPLVQQICDHDRDRHGNEMPPPPYPRDHYWVEVLDQIHEFASKCAQQIDASEQLRASAEIRSRRARSERDQLSVILGGLPDPVLAVNHYDELVLANFSATRLFSIEDPDAENLPLADAVACEELIELIMDVRKRRTPVQRSIEFQWSHDESPMRWYRATCRNLHVSAEQEGNHTSTGAVVVLSDITGQKAVQKRNAEFVSAVSHEMKTPLSGIKAYVELLADGDAEDEETREEFLGVINSQADRLQRLIDNLLNLARIEAGVVNVDKQQCSLNEILEEAREILRPAADQADLELTSELSPMYLGIVADRDLVLQTAINLISNAIKYTAAGGCVTLRSRLVANEVCFEVQDTGVGLSPEDSDRVFEKFYRVPKDHHMASGTGLGLPLAKYIVEDVHGGRLEVHSVPDEGSTFSAIIPCSGAME